MSISNRFLKRASLILSLLFLGIAICPGQVAPNGPTTWWPDPATGLMWAGQSSSHHQGAMTLEQAGRYCAALSLGGYSNWRLPTLHEMRSDVYLYPVTDTYKHDEKTVDYLAMKGGVATIEGTRVWTTSPAGDQQVWSVFMGPPDIFGMLFKLQGKALLDPDQDEAHERVSKVTDHNLVLCVRPLDADIVDIAWDAQLNHPVPDLQTLKANVPLYKARMAFQSEQYSNAIIEARNALAIQANMADAYRGIGISYGMMGQWDEAIANLQAALRIDKNYMDAKDSLAWAKASQKAAKNGKSVKDKPPVWK